MEKTSRTFADGGGQLVVSYARNISHFPTYTPNSRTYLQFARPKVPVLILAGELDPTTENGLGLWFKNGLGGNTTLLNIPYATHGTVAYDAPCVNSIVLQFFSSLGYYYYYYYYYYIS